MKRLALSLLAAMAGAFAALIILFQNDGARWANADFGTPANIAYLVGTATPMALICGVTCWFIAKKRR